MSVNCCIFGVFLLVRTGITAIGAAAVVDHHRDLPVQVLPLDSEELHDNELFSFI